jgi:predicted RNA-binding protein associated with RNAse of E/G family
MFFIDREYDVVYDIVYDIVCDILYAVVMQDGLVPALEPEEASGIITASEQIVKEYASKASLNAKQIKSLIEESKKTFFAIMLSMPLTWIPTCSSVSLLPLTRAI